MKQCKKIHNLISIVYHCWKPQLHAHCGAIHHLHYLLCPCSVHVSGRRALCDPHPHRATWNMPLGTRQQPWGRDWSMPQLQWQLVISATSGHRSQVHESNAKKTTRMQLSTHKTVFALINGSLVFIFFSAACRRRTFGEKRVCQFESRYVEWTAHVCTSVGLMIYANVTYIKNLNCKLADILFSIKQEPPPFF